MNEWMKRWILFLTLFNFSSYLSAPQYQHKGYKRLQKVWNAKSEEDKWSVYQSKERNHIAVAKEQVITNEIDASAMQRGCRPEILQSEISTSNTSESTHQQSHQHINTAYRVYITTTTRQSYQFQHHTSTHQHINSEHIKTSTHHFNTSTPQHIKSKFEKHPSSLVLFVWFLELISKLKQSNWTVNVLNFKSGIPLDRYFIFIETIWSTRTCLSCNILWKTIFRGYSQRPKRFFQIWGVVWDSRKKQRQKKW